MMTSHLSRRRLIGGGIAITAAGRVPDAPSAQAPAPWSAMPSARRLAWHQREVANRECIGAQRIIRLPMPVSARRSPLRIVKAPACPAITDVSLFLGVTPAAIPATQATGSRVLVKTNQPRMAGAFRP